MTFHIHLNQMATIFKTKKLLNLFNIATCQRRSINYSKSFCSKKLELLGQSFKTDQMTNISENVSNKLGKQLHNQKHHPLQIIKTRIVDHFHANFRNRHGGCVFAALDNMNPIVSVRQNFDDLLVPEDHVSRSKNDNYYINSSYMLRAHTTAHEIDLIQSGWNAFLNTGDCYRRDEIDCSHYPIFHQLEGVRIFDDFELFDEAKDSSLRVLEKVKTERTEEKQAEHTIDAARIVEFNLKYTLSKLVEHLFGEETEMRWVDAYFPFTHPSWELEVKLNGEWMEMLGCGILEHGIMGKAGVSDRIGWAFGLGLERFAMKLFDIPDIRLFWSEDPRFLSQFSMNSTKTFKAFSKYPPSYKDISFWVEDDSFSPNDLFELARGVSGDVIEEMTLLDQFKHPESGRESYCFRITYRAMDRTLVDAEVNEMQDLLCCEVVKHLNVTLR